MSAYVTRELILFACSIWQGAVLGFWYDLIKTARKLIRHSHAAVSAEDLCYWIAAALYLFVRIYGENSGILRGYLFAAPWGRCIVPRIVWTLSSGTSGKGNQKSRANPRFSRKMAGKKYEKTEKKVEISWEER